ncbi:MAG: sigma-70 family RNA polymerase sigma factor [Gammaproteobacteria bacterium]|nr:sigma-70 family RNA polymerase sigma factor [Gammaproteobacteria bacterium]MDH3449788.1 sigma-70 family RNA polymerase sigma factor [Gammaproteobacteria bacterium]
MTEAIPNAEQVVYVVDDDPSARESLCWLLDTEGIATRAFDSAESFLGAWSSDWSGCIMVDIRMPGKSGLQLQEELNGLQNRMPVIVLTGHADVPIAIRAMKLGALDFLEKPYSDHELLTSVRSALELGREINRAELEKSRLAEALDTLTEREREVMCLVVEGMTNKGIAAQLGISDKTVEVHRSRVMEKTAARSLSELVRMCLILKDQL